ncbi:MAG: DEAD/DEAH box helicase family protein [Firmicutes bacterium]|nr:DEAD/DEAH box helicase family protein [Bacillota bacterium]
MHTQITIQPFFMFIFYEELYREIAVCEKPTALPAFRLSDTHTQRTGAKQRFRHNLDAIKLIYELDSSGKAASPQQQSILARYAGWGGLSQAFDAFNDAWRNEYNELKELLLPEDYQRANETVLSAFYTPKTVIDAVYAGLKRLGFTGGTVLEPACGTGSFIGCMPPEFTAHIYGVELDPITGKIAKHLYPQANILISGFERTDFPDNFFDAAVTNVPFGAFKVYDPAYEKHNLFIHDYFILKILDKLRAGGIAAVVTSKGTLDKANAAARILFAERAELIAAIRLPNTAFKDTANTNVTSDILFFKAVPQANIDAAVPHWLSVSQDANGIPINNYFIQNPHMILGTMKKGKSLYGSEDETTCESDGRDLATALSEAVQNLPVGICTQAAFNTILAPKLLADDTVKNYCYTVIDGKIYKREGAQLLPEAFSTANEPRMKAMITLRQTVRHLLDIQLRNCSDAELLCAQQKLSGLYSRFTVRYGLLNDTLNRKLFRADADFTLLLSLEEYDEAAGKARKTDVFTKRTIRKYVRPDKAETALEALHICKNEIGKVDLKIIQKLTGKSLNEVIAELDGLIYRNPAACDLLSGHHPHLSQSDGWETAAEYLSGNVKQKLLYAKSVVADYPEFTKNIDALLKVQPVPLSAAEISVRVGAPWIDASVYKQFIAEKFQLSVCNAIELNITFNTFAAEWKVESAQLNFQARSVYGTNRVHGYKLFEYALNLQTPSVYDTARDSDGKDIRILNKPETIAAREKLRILQEEFKAWIFDDPARRSALVELYNDRFNNTVLARYDGSYLAFPEMNPQIELKDYQKDAVERIITSGNTLLHHVVGAGKTFEIAAAAMKLRQLGLAQKPMIVVPNHLTYQWANEFRTLYPNANLLIAGKKDFEKENRLKFVSRIALGDWDAVVIALSSFERLPISQERQERKIQEEIDTIENALIEIRRDRDKRVTVKTLQKILKNKQAALEALSNGKKDSLIKFEDLGVDYLFVDEAHKFKNKFIFTKMNNVAGISRAMSKRSTDLDMKIDYITELHGGQKGVVFATGTPISNSMVEMYTMQSYLAKQALLSSGLRCFDDWAATFGETVTALELAPSGQGYRTKTRFAKFVNLPELLKMYRAFADVKTADMLNLPVPKAIKRVITIKPTDEILRLNDLITERAEKIHAGVVSPEVDNMLKITSDGKKLALDPRCFSGCLTDLDANSPPVLKIDICAENVYRIWLGTQCSSKTQLVFCDLSTPKVKFKDYCPDKHFDVYNHVKYRLIQMGIPECEIAFIHDANTDAAKQALFDSVRCGKVRILLGSTEKCGAGTNVQHKLIAIHHLDTPYRPSDMEQREGRGIRQGNENAEIEIFTYVTERTFDSYSYQILENKQRFISQINKGELAVREAQDIDETTFSYAEIKAITSANPLIKRKNEIETELSSLRVLQIQYRQSRYSLQDNIANYLPKAIARAQDAIAKLMQDIDLRDSQMRKDLAQSSLFSTSLPPSAGFFMSVANKSFTERKDAAELYHKLVCNLNAGKKIATLYGFEIIPEYSDNPQEKYVVVKASGSYRVPVSSSAIGSLTRLENFFKSMEESLTAAKTELSARQSELASAQSELEKPFDHEQKILGLSSELASIEAELNLDKKDIETVIDDAAFQSEISKEETDTDSTNGDK